MSLTINQNVAAVRTVTHVGRTADRLRQSYLRLSSGLRINHAADDAAGLAVSESLRARIASQKVALRNAGDGVSAIQVAEGAFATIHGILGRMRELAVQGASETLADDERQYLHVELQGLIAGIDDIAATTAFGGLPLLDGTHAAAGLQVQVGDEGTADDRIRIPLWDATANGLGVHYGDIAFTTAAGCVGSLWRIDRAIDLASEYRGELGAAQNRLGTAAAHVQTSIENLSVAESRIRDVDFGEETAAMGRGSTFQQAGLSVLAQANSTPERVLELLQ
ncbi:flagellin FliC [Myxococcota bacterium]|nr:flagellin FliC [Myxococcota bacterium]